MSLRNSPADRVKPSLQSECGKRTPSVAARVNGGGLATSSDAVNDSEPNADWPKTAPEVLPARSRSRRGIRHPFKSEGAGCADRVRNLAARVGAFGFR